MNEVKQKVEKVVLIGLYTGKESREEYLSTVDELEQLSQTAGAVVVAKIVQNLPEPNTKTYVGKGKITEIADIVKEEECTAIIFNDDLTPAQAKNISQLIGCKVIDRTELILDIFAIHAKSKEAKMQVELAMLEHNYSKLRNLWKHFSRIEGGIGLRGPGETQIEIDRREIKRKISLLKNKLLDIDKVAQTKRKKRNNLLNVSLIGYTNAGKTTLFNRLTKETNFVANQLFATLDSTSRVLFLKNTEKVILSDTIGFIKKLPHSLVTSFHSTLLEVTEADLLLHIVDLSTPDCELYIQAVNDVLKEIKAYDKDILYVFNKADTLTNLSGKLYKKKLMLNYPNSIFISAKFDTDFSDMLKLIGDYLQQIKHERVFRIPDSMTKLINYIEENGEISDSSYDDKTNEYVFKVKTTKETAKAVTKQISDFYTLQYINQK